MAHHLRGVGLNATARPFMIPPYGVIRLIEIVLEDLRGTTQWSASISSLRRLRNPSGGLELRVMCCLIIAYAS